MPSKIADKPAAYIDTIPPESYNDFRYWTCLVRVYKGLGETIYSHYERAFDGFHNVDAVADYVSDLRNWVGVTPEFAGEIMYVVSLESFSDNPGHVGYMDFHLINGSTTFAYPINKRTKLDPAKECLGWPSQRKGMTQKDSAPVKAKAARKGAKAIVDAPTPEKKAQAPQKRAKRKVPAAQPVADAPRPKSALQKLRDRKKMANR